MGTPWTGHKIWWCNVIKMYQDVRKGMSFTVKVVENPEILALKVTQMMDHLVSVTESLQNVQCFTLLTVICDKTIYTLKYQEIQYARRFQNSSICNTKLPFTVL